jgi:hypothetical protein
MECVNHSRLKQISRDSAHLVDFVTLRSCHQQDLYNVCMTFQRCAHQRGVTRLMCTPGNPFSSAQINQLQF